MRRRVPRAEVGAQCLAPAFFQVRQRNLGRRTHGPPPSPNQASCLHASILVRCVQQNISASGQTARAGTSDQRGCQGGGGCKASGCKAATGHHTLACAMGGPGPGKGTHRGSRPQWPATQPGKACSKVSSGCGVTLLPSGWRGVGMGRGRPPIRYSFPPSSLSVLWGNLTRHST